MFIEGKKNIVDPIQIYIRSQVLGIHTATDWEKQKDF